MNEIVKDAETATKEVLAEIDGTHEEAKIGAAPEQPIPINKKLTKLEEKRMQIFNDRLRRVLNKNPKLTEQQAARILQVEDYERMPVDLKIKRLESFIVQNVQGFTQDIQELRHNQTVIADSIDVNFRAFARGLIVAGVPIEKQKEIIDAVVVEINADRAKKVEEAKVAEKKALDDGEQKLAEQVLQAAEAGRPEPAAKEGEEAPKPIPEGATEFGG